VVARPDDVEEDSAAVVDGVEPSRSVVGDG